MQRSSASCIRRWLWADCVDICLEYIDPLSGRLCVHATSPSATSPPDVSAALALLLAVSALPDGMCPHFSPPFCDVSPALCSSPLVLSRVVSGREEVAVRFSAELLASPSVPPSSPQSPQKKLKKQKQLETKRNPRYLGRQLPGTVVTQILPRFPLQPSAFLESALSSSLARPALQPIHPSSCLATSFLLSRPLSLPFPSLPFESFPSAAVKAVPATPCYSCCVLLRARFLGEHSPPYLAASQSVSPESSRSQFAPRKRLPPPISCISFLLAFIRRPFLAPIPIVPSPFLVRLALSKERTHTHPHSDSARSPQPRALSRSASHHHHRRRRRGHKSRAVWWNIL